MQRATHRSNYRKPIVSAMMRGMPRTLGVQLAYDLWLELEGIAKRENISKAEIARRLIEKWVAENK